MRILIVEDNVDQAQTMLRWCLGQGHDAKSALTAGEAFELLKSWWPDVAIIDIMLPDVSGIDIALTIRDEPRDAAAPMCLIAATACNSPAELTLGRAAGFNHYLIKPFEWAALAGAMAEFAALRAAKSDADSAKTHRME